MYHELGSGALVPPLERAAYQNGYDRHRDPDGEMHTNDARPEMTGRPPHPTPGGRMALIAVLLLSLCSGTPAHANEPQGARANYLLKLKAYTLARQKYDELASAYWNAIGEKRRARLAKRRDKQEIVIDDYVLTQPPVYTGPPRPVDPTATPEDRPPPSDIFPSSRTSCNRRRTISASSRSRLAARSNSSAPMQDWRPKPGSRATR